MSFSRKDMKDSSDLLGFQIVQVVELFISLLLIRVRSHFVQFLYSPDPLPQLPVVQTCAAEHLPAEMAYVVLVSTVNRSDTHKWPIVAILQYTFIIIFTDGKCNDENGERLVLKCREICSNSCFPRTTWTKLGNSGHVSSFPSRPCLLFRFPLSLSVPTDCLFQI